MLEWIYLKWAEIKSCFIFPPYKSYICDKFIQIILPFTESYSVLKINIISCNWNWQKHVLL
jgi:hypothetical protein